MNACTKQAAAALIGMATLVAAPIARADAVTEWNEIADRIGAGSQQPAGRLYRAMAITQSAVYEAVNAITGRYPPHPAGSAQDRCASVVAAVASANRAVLTRLFPTRQTEIERAYADALAPIPETSARGAGIAVGERAAAAVLARRSDDDADRPDTYRPATAPGVYVPTTLPLFSRWPERTPWMLARPDQFRPGPPPALDGAAWASDYEEVRRLGARGSTARSALQTDIARFWGTSLPSTYFAVVRSVADSPGREPTRNARLLMAASQALDDGLIAVFDAKYHYGFWRPITAIRNGDRDGNDSTQRTPSWLPLIDTPLHPEYPCAHCVSAASIGVLLTAETGDGPTPTLSATSPSAPGRVRSWSSVDAFVSEVNEARIHAGVHFRAATSAGNAIGEQVGALAAKRYLGAPAAVLDASADRGSGAGAPVEACPAP